MTDLRKAAEMALKHLENNSPDTDTLMQVEPHVWEHKGSLVIQALRQALAQPDLAKVGEVGVWGNSQALAEPANSTTDFVEPKASSQTEQEPLVWMNKYGHVASFQNEEYKDPLYTAPPKREWVGLTDDDIAQAMFRSDAIFTGPMQFKFAQAIEAKLKEKNT